MNEGEHKMSNFYKVDVKLPAGISIIGARRKISSFQSVCTDLHNLYTVKGKYQ